MSAHKKLGGRGTFAAVLVAAVLIVPGAASAASDNANAKSSGNGTPPQAGIGNPHQPGATGDPHAPGETGNPHPGSAPYGVANGQDQAPGLEAPTTEDLSRAVVAAPGGNGNGGNGDGGNGGDGDNGVDKVAICHLTVSETNPYEFLEVPPSAVNGHAQHGDLIPAPGGSCNEDDPAVQDAIAELDYQGPDSSLPSGGGDSAGTLADTASGSEGAPAAADVAQEGAAAGTLPYTGLALGTLLSIAIVLLFCGWLVRGLETKPRVQ